MERSNNRLGEEVTTKERLFSRFGLLEALSQPSDQVISKGVDTLLLSLCQTDW
jgi:hypothetical protein